jgi:hypothetical protein
MTERWVIDTKKAAAPQKCTDKFGHAMDPAHQCEATQRGQGK